MNHAGPSFSTPRLAAARSRSTVTAAARRRLGLERLAGAVRAMALVALVLVLQGCGEVEWFPDYVRLPTTPDAFTFTAQTGTEKSTAEKPVLVTSSAITVAGLTGASSPISVTGTVGSDSKYSINGATPTGAAGTVKNDDTVTVTHTASSALGTPTTSTLTIGNVSANFVSTTRLVGELSFSSSRHIGIVPAGTLVESSALIDSVDTIAHVITIKDSISSGAAVFTISPDLTPDTQFVTSQTTASLDGRYVLVRGIASTTTSPVVTTLTIDGIDYQVPLTIAQ